VKKLRSLLFLVILAVLIGAGAWLFRDTTPPGVGVTPEDGPISARRPLLITLADPGLGVKNLRVTFHQTGKTGDLLVRDYPEGTSQIEETVALAGAGLQEGPVEIQVRAVDRAHFRFGKGNATERTLTFEVDNKPPQIEVLTSHHNFNQGGAGVVVYTLSEDVDQTGVKVGTRFFPGYRQPSGTYICFFAAPWDLATASFAPKVQAVDRAGNERLAGFYHHINPRTFPTDRITISASFLSNKIVPDFQHFFPETLNPLELFLKVNRDLRQTNLATILEFGRKTSPTPLWEGVFLGQPNSAVPGAFAQRRTYYHEGQVIDHQTHLGIDLASVAHAPIQAANAGTVIFADDLGIYGQCVVIDHGLGLQTLYGHMSQIGVQPGDLVRKGQIIGRTGATGLAGGDHLHFDVLLSGQQVNPLEWWDSTWLKHNVLDKLAIAGK
jgi:hypothetical protein